MFARISKHRGRWLMQAWLLTAAFASAISGCAWSTGPVSVAVSDAEHTGYGRQYTLRHSLVGFTKDRWWFSTGLEAMVVRADDHEVDALWQIYGRQATAIRYCSPHPLSGAAACQEGLIYTEKLLRFVDPVYFGADQPALARVPASLSLVATPWRGVWATDSERHLYYCSVRAAPECHPVTLDGAALNGWPLGLRTLSAPTPSDVLWIETNDHEFVRCVRDAEHAVPVCARANVRENAATASAAPSAVSQVVPAQGPDHPMSTIQKRDEDPCQS